MKPISVVLDELDACQDAIDWCHAREERGFGWRRIFSHLCDTYTFAHGDNEDVLYRAPGEEWIGWLIGRLGNKGYLSVAKVLKAEIEVWRTLPELHPFFPPGDLDALYRWSAGDPSGIVFPDGYERQDPRRERTEDYLWINAQDLKLMTRSLSLPWFSGTWNFMIAAVQLSGLDEETQKSVIVRLGNLVDQHHGDRVIRALESYADDMEDDDAEEEDS